MDHPGRKKPGREGVPGYIMCPGGLIALLLLFFACTERIEIDTEPEFVRLVVDGALTTEAGPHQVRLSLTGDYFGGRPAPPVTGAEVSLLVAGPAGGDGAWRRRDLLCSSKKIARFQVEPGD